MNVDILCYVPKVEKHAPTKIQRAKLVCSRHDGRYYLSMIVLGMIGTVVSHPFEIIRARLQAGELDHNKTHTYSGVWNGLRKIWELEGLDGYYPNVT
jgi:hypothetical protein